MLNDTLGYIVKRFTDWDGNYVSVDTSYITGFNGKGWKFHSTNRSSYSNRLGEINNMIFPVKNMVGDTLMLGRSLEWWTRIFWNSS